MNSIRFDVKIVWCELKSCGMAGKYYLLRIHKYKSETSSDRVLSFLPFFVVDVGLFPESHDQFIIHWKLAIYNHKIQKKKIPWILIIIPIWLKVFVNLQPFSICEFSVNNIFYLLLSFSKFRVLHFFCIWFSSWISVENSPMEIHCAEMPFIKMAKTIPRTRMLDQVLCKLNSVCWNWSYVCKPSLLCDFSSFHFLFRLVVSNSKSFDFSQFENYFVI